jgi:hypothetical protein
MREGGSAVIVPTLKDALKNSSPWLRVQRSRAKGWRMPAATIFVGRPTKWGNPYTLLEWELPLALELYERSVTGYWSPGGIPDEKIDRAYQLHTAFRKRFFSLEETRNLRGWHLACWCKLDQPCHADILLRLANA